MSLKEAARIAVEKVHKIQKGESVLIITNPEKDVRTISNALFDAANEIGAFPSIIVQPRKTVLDFADPVVYAAMRAKPDVVFSISDGKMGKDRESFNHPIVYQEKEFRNYYHFLLDGEKSLRSSWTPGITLDIFERTICIDYDRLEDECGRIKEILDQADSVTITTEAGTDLYIGLKGRVAFSDDGAFDKPGTGGNLPAGESYISPELGTAEGKIVFDGSISVKSGTLVIKDPIIAEVSQGFVTSIEGGQEADILMETITEGEDLALKLESEGSLPQGEGALYRKNARNLGELGIGLNPAAVISGNMLEDEKAYKTCHIAIGSNYDEDAEALIHLDGVIKFPTIIAVVSGKEIPVLIDGNLVAGRK